MSWASAFGGYEEPGPGRIRNDIHTRDERVRRVKFSFCPSVCLRYKLQDLPVKENI